MCNLIEIRSTCTHMSSFFAHVVGYHQIFYHPLGHAFHLIVSEQFVNHPLGHTFHLTFSEQFVNHSLICSDYFYKWRSISLSKKEWLRDIEIHVAWVFNLKKKIFKTFWLKKPKHPYKFSYILKIQVCSDHGVRSQCGATVGIQNITYEYVEFM